MGYGLRRTHAAKEITMRNLETSAFGAAALVAQALVIAAILAV